MNCKPGDMAIVIKTSEGRAKDVTYDGKAVDRIIDLDIRGVIVECVSVYADPVDGLPNWNIVKRRVKWKGTLPDGRQITGEGKVYTVPDCCLRPLRDDEGEDETLTWAGLPGKKKEPVAA